MCMFCGTSVHLYLQVNTETTNINHRRGKSKGRAGFFASILYSANSPSVCVAAIHAGEVEIRPTNPCLFRISVNRRTP